MKKERTLSMTEGSVTKALILFAIPIFIGNLFQNLYNIVDTAIIGNVLGDTSLAAMGTVAPLYTIVISFLMGIANGFAIILAQNYGAEDWNSFRKNMSLVYLLSVLIVGILTILSQGVLHPILVMLHTPDEIIGQAESYMRIIICFSFVTMLYNMFAASLRAIGDSRTPLFFLMISSVLNGILDVVFIKGCHMGVEGAAYATVISQTVSVILCFGYVWKKERLLRFSYMDLAWDWDRIRDLLTSGISMSLMTVVFIGSVALQSAVNSLGNTIITAHTAARKIHDVIALPIGTVSTSVATFVGQNMGKKDYERIYEGLKKGLFLVTCWCAFAAFLAFEFGRQAIWLLTGTDNEEVVRNAYFYLRVNSLFYFSLGGFMTIRSTIQGMGRKLVPILSSMSELVLKFAAVPLIVGVLGYFGVCILEPITWTVGMTIVTVDFLLLKRRIQKGYSK